MDFPVPSGKGIAHGHLEKQSITVNRVIDPVIEPFGTANKSNYKTLNGLEYKLVRVHALMPVWAFSP